MSETELEKLKRVTVMVVSFKEPLNVSLDALLFTPSDPELGCAINKIIHSKKECNLILLRVLKGEIKKWVVV